MQVALVGDAIDVAVAADHQSAGAESPVGAVQASVNEIGVAPFGKFFFGPAVKVWSKVNLPAGVRENTVPPNRNWLLGLDPEFAAVP